MTATVARGGALAARSGAGRARTPVARFLRRGRSVVGAGIVLLAFAVALLAPVLAPHPPNALVGDEFKPPSVVYPLGTDHLGRDVLSRLIWGTRIALLFAVGATILSVAIGVVLGLIAGFFGGWVDHVLSRIFEIFLILPRLFLILLVATVFGAKILLSMLIVGLTIWPSNARLMRGSVLAVRGRPFVEAATALGATPWRIMRRHILPNAVTTLIANTTLQAAEAILLEASLGYFGIGDANVPSWGQMLRDAQAYLAQQWWLATAPGIAISLLVLGFTFLGDGLGQVLDPRLAEQRRPGG